MGVCCHVRDLGAHMNMGKRAYAPTIAARVRRAILVLRRMRSVPASTATEMKVIMGKVMPMIMYGTQVSPTPKKLVESARAAIADAMDPEMAGCRATSMVMNACHAFTCDPGCHIMLAKIMNFRRSWWMFPERRDSLMIAWYLCDNSGCPACKPDDDSDVEDRSACVMNWTDQASLKGPMGFLLYDLMKLQLTMSSDATLWYEGKAVLNILHGPIQRLKPCMIAHARSVMLSQVAEKRKCPPLLPVSTGKPHTSPLLRTNRARECW